VQDTREEIERERELEDVNFNDKNQQANILSYT
jgi:hypothetical protein